MPLIAAEVEGPVSSITAAGDGAEIVVMGVTVVVDKNLIERRKIRTPTASLTIAQLVDPTSFPGRTAAGFVGGTVIARGNYDKTSNRLIVKFQPIPSDEGDLPFEEFPAIEIEPAENLMLGEITANAGGALTINGVSIRRLPANEQRMPGGPVLNDFGFEVKPGTIAPGTPGSAEGYFSSTDNAFFAHTLTIDGDAVLTTLDPQLSITRAQGRNRGAEYDLELRGGFTQSHINPGTTNQDIQVFRVDEINGVTETRFLGRPRVTILAGDFGRWRFSARLTAGAAPYDKAPTHVVVENRSPGASTAKAKEDDVEIIKE